MVENPPNTDPDPIRDAGPGTTRPSRPYMWVAPVVSFAVLVGFFVMLGFLLHQQLNTQPSAVAPPAESKSNSGNPSSALGGATSPTSTTTTTSGTGGSGSTTTASTGETNAPNKSTPPSSAPAGGLQNVLFTLLGALGAAFTQVVNFWLGSSKGSADKTDLLAAQSSAQK